MKNELMINVIFDAARGDVSVASREAAVGKPFGELPRPSRSGYTFDGWYWNGAPVTAETLLETDDDITLVAHWVKKQGSEKSRSVYKKQKIAVLVLSIVAVALIIALLIVNQIVAVAHRFEDEYTINGISYSDTYVIKRVDGIYAMYDKDGNICEINPNEGNTAGTTSGETIYIAGGSGNQYIVNDETGEYRKFAVVDYGEGEEIGFGQRILIIPHIKQANVYSIKVENQHGTYTFYRHNTDAKKGVETLKGYENSTVIFNQELYVSLVVDCGYTLTQKKLDLSTDYVAPRLPDGSVDYSAYGLVDKYDENGNLVYSPAIYTITPNEIVTRNSKGADPYDYPCFDQYADGDYIAKVQRDANGAPILDADGNAIPVSYSIKVGDALLSGGGYYVQLIGRDAVYVLASSIANTVLQPVEAMVTPMVAYPASTATYTMVQNFVLSSYQGDFRAEFMEEIRRIAQIKDEDERDAAMEEMLENFEKKTDQIVAFTYQDLEERTNTITTSRPYISFTDLMKGYEINDNNASEVLSMLYQMQFVKCEKLGLSNMDWSKYEEFGEGVHVLSYDSPVLDSNNNTVGYITNLLFISSMTENGTYYIASLYSDMVVEVEPSHLAFLGWERSDWYHQYFFQQNICYVDKISIEINGDSYRFTLDNSQSYVFYDKGGTMTRVDLEKGSLAGEAGNWIYIDENGTSHATKSFDLSKGALYLKLTDPKDATDTMTVPYYKYLKTVDRNQNTYLELTWLENGKETTVKRRLSTKDATDYQVSLIYRDDAGVEYQVLGTYNINGQNANLPYMLTYWQEVAQSDGTYKWEQPIFYNIATDLILRDAAGKNYTLSLVSNNLKVFCDRYEGNADHELDYSITYKYQTDTGGEKQQTVTAIDNFRDLYQVLMWYSIEGDIDFSELGDGTGDLKGYLANTAPSATISYHFADKALVMNTQSYTDYPENAEAGKPTPEAKVWLANNERYVIVRLYQYTATKSLITIEVVESFDENGNPITDPTKAEGSFYVLTSYCNTLLDALQDLVNERPIDPRSNNYTIVE